MAPSGTSGAALLPSTPGSQENQVVTWATVSTRTGAQSFRCVPSLYRAWTQSVACAGARPWMTYIPLDVQTLATSAGTSPAAKTSSAPGGSTVMASTASTVS